VLCWACRYTNGGKDVAKYKDTTPVAKSVWVELNNSWHGEAQRQQQQHLKAAAAVAAAAQGSCMCSCCIAVK
jgi:hypothetical protein